MLSLASHFTQTKCLQGTQGRIQGFQRGGAQSEIYTCIHHTECPSLEGGSKSGMITQIK